MSAQQHRPDWARLFRIACGLIRQVNSESLIIDHWTFGGGTAMMLQIDHRESHDVDVFLQEPQLLGYLDPQKRDFSFETWPSDSTGDGSRFLKFVFDDIGEIDFIVDAPKTADPAIERIIEGEKALLQALPEIIAKKIVHRGSNITPRDIFDIAASGEHNAVSIILALRPYKTDVTEAIKRLALLNREFVNNAISQLQIRDKFRPVARTAIDRAKEILQAV